MNQIIWGIDFNPGDYVYVSPFEHNAILRPLNLLSKKIGFEICLLPFDKETWNFNIRKCSDDMVLKHPRAVFVSQVSNVTGFHLPYSSIFELSQKYNAVNVLDASQGFGIFPIDKSGSIDYIVFAGHKSLYAGFGIAGFIRIGQDRLTVVKAGGTGSDSLNLEMPDYGYSRYEAGSPNIVSIYGLNSSIDWLKSVSILEQERNLTDYLIKRLSEVESVIIFKPDSVEITGIVSFAVRGSDSNDVGQLLADEYDICVRTGYHCAPLIHDFIESREFNGTIRVSFGFFNSIQEVDRLIEVLETL